jgi:ABC-2 type transport system ATP-binding protein
MTTEDRGDTPAIEVVDLVRTYRAPKVKGQPPGAPVMALDHVSLTVPRGELFGLLGPNGAGKTTLIKVLTTLLLPTGGLARVAGFDVANEPQRVRERIAVVSGGETSGYGLLTVREQLWMFSQFYGLPSQVAYARIDGLLEILGLAEARDKKVSDLSTGMRQKMNLIRGLVPDPDVLFLDEPTVGLDVGAARDIRAYIQRWMAERPERTVLLTTHYLHEADELCDRVAIIHKGGIVACDTPEALRRSAAADTYFLITTEPLDGHDWLAAVPGVRQVTARSVDGATELRLELADDGAIAGVIGALTARNRRIFGFEKCEPSLEDVFVKIVGLRLNEADEDGPA